jgi:hypothetical protein
MIYLIITASILDKYTKQPQKLREDLYVKSIKTTLDFLPKNIQPIIVENNGKRETVLDSFGIPVLYTNNNNTFRDNEKGEKELKDIKDVIQAFTIQDDDIIIKLTGRYPVLSSYFFDFVIAHTYDAYIKFFNVCSEKYDINDCVLGLFAIQCKLLKNFNYEKQYASILKFLKIPRMAWEIQFATYIRQLNINLCEMNRLDVECNTTWSNKCIEV